MYCSYYQASIKRNQVWFLVGILRSFEHLLFERTLNKQESVFEFLVPSDLESYFLEIMNYFIEKQVVTNLQKLPNRFAA